MTTDTPRCDLCGQPVEIAGFTCETPEGQKAFCCQGCLSLYQLLNPEHPTPPTTDNKEPNL